MIYSPNCMVDILLEFCSTLHVVWWWLFIASRADKTITNIGLLVVE